MSLTLEKEEIKTTAGILTVREIPWLHAREFLTRLADAAKSLVKDGEVKLSPETVAGLITQSSDLAEFLVLKTVLGDGQQPISKPAIDGLGLSEFMELLDKSIELNVNPALFERSKKVAGRIKSAFLGNEITTSQTPQ